MKNRILRTASIIIVVGIFLSCVCFRSRASAEKSFDQVIWDNEYATIKFIKLEPSIGIIGYYLYLDVQNKSDSTLLIGVPQSAINNYSCSIGFGSGIQITPGNSALSMTLLPTQMNYEHLYNIKFKLDIIDDKWNDLAESDWIEIDLSDRDDRSKPDAEIEVPAPFIDNDIFSISYLSTEPVEGISSQKMLFHVTNKTDRTILVSLDQGALDKRMCASVIGSEFSIILEGNKSIMPIIFNMLEEIGEIEKAQFRVNVRDYDTFDNLFESDLITIDLS